MSSNTNLGNTPVNQGYVQLIHTGETGGIDGTLRTLYDGDGTASDLQIASNKVKVSTELYIGSKTATEFIQDIVGDMFTTGSYTNITTTYDDTNGNIDLSASGEVTLTGTQTLTNKTLASPIVTGNLVADSIDVAGDLTLDADGADIILKDGGTEYGRLSQVLGGLTLKSGSSSANAVVFTTSGGSIFAGDVSFPSTMTFDSVALTAVQTSSESFADNDTSLMTSAAINDKIGTEVASLVDSAPSSLDTLNELAAALGDDANFSTTVTNNIATKLAKASNLSDLANVATARTNLGVDAAGTDNSTNVTLAGSLDYLTLSGQQITRNAIDLTTDVTGVLPSANLDSDTAHLSGTQTFSGAKTFSSALSISNNGGLLNLIGTDHSYIQYYPGGSGSTRGAYVGFGSGSTDHFYVANEKSDGDMFINVNDGGSTFTAIRIDASADGRVRLPNDTQQLSIGADQDLRLYRSSTTSNIVNYNDGLTIQNAGAGATIIKNTSSNQDMFFQVLDDTTTKTAIRIDASDNARVRLANDNQRLAIGEDDDFTIHHSGSHTFVQNTTGNFLIRNQAHGSKLQFGTEDSSGTLAYVLNITGDNHRVGIGTTTPAQKLEVNGRVRASGFDVVDTGAVIYRNNNDLELITYSGYDINLMPSGNVGIGTTSPARSLQVNGDGIIRVLNDSGDAGIDFNASDMQLRYRSATDKLQFYSYGTSSNVMTIQKSDGNVGIGIESPETPLHVNQDSNNHAFKVTGGGGGASIARFVRDIGLNSPYAEVNIHAGGGDPQITFRDVGNKYFSIGIDDSANAFKISDNSAVGTNDRLTIDTSGNVGIGTESPSEKLEVSGGGADTFIEIHNSGGYESGLKLVGGSLDIWKVYLDDADNNFYIYEDSNQKLKITAAGAVTFNNAYTFPTGIGSEKYILTAEGSNVSFFDYNSSTLTPTASGDKMLIIDVSDSNNLKIADAPVNVPNVSGTTANGVLTYNSTGGGGAVNVTTESALTFDGTDLAIAATGKIYLDGGSDTYIHNPSGDTIDIVAGGQQMLRLFEGGTDYVHTDDNVRLGVGNSPDFYIYHDATNTHQINTTGDLIIKNAASDEDISIQVSDGGSTTTAILIDGSDVGRVILPNDNQKLTIGAGYDLNFYNNGSASYIQNNNNVLYINQTAAATMQIRNSSSDQDITFSVNDGGSQITALQIDSSDAGSAIFSHDVKVNDNGKLKAGSGNDFHLIHDGSHNYIMSNGSDQDIYIRVNDGGTFLTAIRTDTSDTAAVKLPNDGQKLTIGASDDLRLQHNGSHSFIQQYGTGDLYIDNTIDDKSIFFRTDDGSGGVTTYLAIRGDEGQMRANKQLRMQDNVMLQVGSSGDGQFFHNTADTFLKSTTGMLQIQNTASNQDIRFSVNDGGSTTNILTLNSASSRVGINTTNPLDRFDVYDAGNLTVRFRSGADMAQIRFQNNTQNWYEGINSAEQFFWYSGQVGATTGFINTNGNLYWNYHFLNNVNGYGLVGRDTGGSTRNTIKIDSSNNVLVGDSSLAGNTYTYSASRMYINTDAGQVQIGPQNSSWNHIYTDRPGHLFDKNPTSLDGKFQSYSGVDLNLRRSQGDTDRLLIQSGIATFSQSLHVEKGLSVDPKTHSLNSDARYHINVLSHRDNTSRAGAFIIDTDIPRNSNRMSVIHVHGHAYGDHSIIDFKICFYPYSGVNGPDGNAGSVINYSLTDDGNDGKPKFVGINSSGNVAIAIDDYDGANKYFWHFQVDWYNGTSAVQTPTWSVSTSTTDGFGWIQERVMKAPIVMDRTGAQTANVRINTSLGVNANASGTAGRLDCGNDVVAFSTSDERLKENVKPLDNALDKVLQISGVEFDWKELTEEEKKTIHGNEGHDVGVIAQEIEEVLPEVVTERDTGYKAVKYEKIVPLLIQAIKEQQQQIEELKNG